MANYSVRFLRWIDRQKHAIAEHDLQAFDRAILIPSAPCAPTDADRPDHLAVNHDGKAAGVREESELNQLTRVSTGIIAKLSISN
jgi:hypothetical protein